MFLIVTRQVHDISRKLFVFQPVSVGDDEVIAAVNTRFFFELFVTPDGHYTSFICNGCLFRQ